MVAKHNNPPPDAVFALHVDELFTLMSDTLTGGEVLNDEQEAAIDALKDDFHKAWKDSDAARAEEKKPFDDGAKEVQAKWKPIVDKADRGKKACGDALTPYRTAKQRAKDEAARKVREEAEERQRQAQEALRQSDDLDARFRAEQELELAKKIGEQAKKIDRSATGLRTYWEAEITDRSLALKHYLAHQPEAFVSMIQELAGRDARGARPRVPGITYNEIKKAS